MNCGPGSACIDLKSAAADPANGMGVLSGIRGIVTERGKGKSVKAVAHSADHQELARVKGGDREAYRYFVEKYQERAYAIAYSVLRDAHDAEDVVQESFVKAYFSLPDFRSASGFYTWLYRIVYNMAVDFKRKAARRAALTKDGESPDVAVSKEAGSSSDLALSGSLSGPQDMALRREQAAAIQRVLSSLTDEHRAVMVLREVDGLSYDEIARVVGVSKGTVMSRLFYARRKMQEALIDFAPSGWKAGNGTGDGAFSAVAQSGSKTFR